MKLKGKVLLVFLAAIGLSLSLTTAVYAGSQAERIEKEGVRPEARESRMEEINRQLHLSPEQDRQLQAQRNRHEKQKEELNERIRVKKEELKQELEKQELCMEKVNQLHAELKVLLGQREDHRLEHILEIRNILTPEQLKKFLALIERYHTEAEGKEQSREKSKD